MLQAHATSDAGEYLDRCGEFLRSRPVEHGVLLSVARLWVGASEADAAANTWLWVDDGTDVIAAAMQTALGTGVSPGPDEAVRLLAHELWSRHPRVPSVSGVRASAEAFADEWQRLGGPAVASVHGNGAYVCRQVRPPRPVPGSLRRASEADLTLLRPWGMRFLVDIGHEPEEDDPLLGKVAAGLLLVWEVDGRPVSMAAHTPPEAGVTRVQWVYTPDDLRARGYASALVAELTSTLLASGLTCMLYTDLANPTSNKVYLAIGYERVGETVTLTFDR